MKSSIVFVTFVVGFAAGVLTAAQAPSPSALPAERVTGIGGVFIKARDPKALRAWYRDTLGIGSRDGSGFSVFEWRERDDPDRVGTTAWALFRSDSNYFAPSQAPFMINYRVRDLDRMLAQLRAQGVAVESKVAEESNGKFAWVVDPEGNKIELFEPKAGH